jgi:hypothetical protein
LLDAGFNLIIVSSKALTFSLNFSAPKDTFPTGESERFPLFPRGIQLYPLLVHSPRWPLQKLPFPTLGLGINPRGPKILPIFTHGTHHIRRGDNTIKLHPAAFNLFNNIVITD